MEAVLEQNRIDQKYPSFLTDKLFAKKLFLISVWIFSVPFVYYAYLFGWDYVSDGQSERGVFSVDMPSMALYLIALHMMFGAMMNFLAPYQVYLGLNHNANNQMLHRWVGVVTLSIAFFAAIVGTLYFTLYQDVNFWTGETHRVYPVYQAGGNVRCGDFLHPF